MSVQLVSTNDHPVPAKYPIQLEWVTVEFHPAEHLQADEQAEANGIAAFVADRILTFIAGIAVCLVSEIVILLIVKGVWS